MRGKLPPMRWPFLLTRPWLLITGMRVNRRKPDLRRLRGISNPEAFVWAVLPHAARTFAVSILLLPARQARAAAIGYLYCRMLDTYEDIDEPGRAAAALQAFGARMRTLGPLPPLPDDGPDRASVDSLLIEKHELIDRAFLELAADEQAHIVALVEAMATGMVWSTERFAAQGGVLESRAQLQRYCHTVIGEPTLFVLLLLGRSELTPEQHQDALASSELIQLANITRDIEKDLARGIGYHPSLRPHLGRQDAPDPVRAVRRRLMAHALSHVTSYTRLAGQLAGGRFSPVRSAALAMLLHTDRHYRWCADRAGVAAWSGPTRPAFILLASLPATVSPWWTRRMMARIERNMLATASALA